MLDEGVAPRSKSGVQQQILHILEPGLTAVDPVFTAGIPVQTTGQHNFFGGPWQRRVRHFQSKFHFGHAHGLPLARAREDHIGHLRAAQQAGPLLAQHPGQGIRDIRLAAAVGSHNGRHANRKGQLLRVGKGFEAVEFE